MKPDPLIPTTADRLGVFDLFARYAWALDTADKSSFLDCFAADGELIQGSGADARTFSGHSRIEEFIDELFAIPEFAGRQHHVGQSTFRSIPETGHVAVRSYFFISEVHADAAPHLYLAGYYDDICGLDGSRWIFHKRLYARWRGDVLQRFAEISPGE